MNLVNSQNIKLIHRNPLHSYTLTVKNQKEKLRKNIPFTTAAKQIKYLPRETYMQVRKQQLELDMEQQTGSK